jgi:hypothetical protein
VDFPRRVYHHIRHQLVRFPGKVDLAPGSNLHQAGGKVHRIADDRIVHAQIAPHIPGDDHAGVEADMESERTREIVRTVCIKPFDVGHHIQRTPYGAFGIVFVSQRRPENRHDPVADELVNRPLVSQNDGDQSGKTFVEDGRQIFGIHFFGEGGETRDIGKQDGDEAAFALDLLPGGKNALCKIARDVSLKK